ncbi:aldo/keto reductase [Bombilactobacillus thymidiniphilus]|uniref:Aldo/keto reductase n=1 Tax=Bombilactobacillus thymidiniphilus TaxID=2923363 RepID=A0ABY4PBN4_9LACO|nr:aldo/keto reductase [Bombilactobacillus thymidiniphilus]UQS83054.1 aldo/keto reductase [Bombilactobacillus thymidiniphilus]
MIKVPKITLNNQVEMPQIGLELAQTANQKIIENALANGYRSFDLAQIYTNESMVGQALHSSKVKREDLFLTEKVWISNFGFHRTKKAIEQVLSKLQTDYLDLVLLHQPFNDYYGAYHALEDLYHEGLVRAIGVANFLPDRYLDLAKFSQITPAIDQLETHILFQQQQITPYLKDYDTRIQAWEPLAQNNPELLNNQLLQNLAQKYHKTVTQIALRFLVQQGMTVLTPVAEAKVMHANIDIWDFQITIAEMQQLTALDRKEPYIFDYHDPRVVNAILRTK